MQLLGIHLAEHCLEAALLQAFRAGGLAERHYGLTALLGLPVALSVASVLAALAAAAYVLYAEKSLARSSLRFFSLQQQHNTVTKRRRAK